MRNQFEALYRISQILNSTLDIEELLRRVMDVLLEHTGAERGFFLLREEKNAPFEFKIGRNIQKEDVTEDISTKIIKEVEKERKPILSVNAREDPRFKDSETVLTQSISSVISAPIFIDEELRGIIYLDSSLKSGLFTKDTLNFLELFTNIVSIALKNALLYSSLKKEHERLKRITQFGDLIGVSEKMQHIFDLIKKTAAVDCPVLILGESGTGKELVARAIHFNSARKNKEFVPLYCGGLPETLIESELFGHKKGAFTGAHEDKKGLFEVAHEGTLFLDEVCDIPIETQAKLLRAIELGEIRRVGDTKIKKVNVRIISATNKDVEEEIKEKRFREDLYYRLNVITIRIPPLRERKEDIPALASYFVKKYGKKWGKENLVLSDAAIKKLMEWHYPGNVRELENIIQKAVLLCQGTVIKPEHIQWEEKKELKPRTLEEIEKKVILERIKEFGGNKKKAAESLGIPVRTLYHKLKQWGISSVDLK